MAKLPTFLGNIGLNEEGSSDSRGAEQRAGKSEVPNPLRPTNGNEVLRRELRDFFRRTKDKEETDRSKCPRGLVRFCGKEKELPSLDGSHSRVIFSCR